MITDWTKKFSQWMERRQKRRDALEEARGYEHATRLFWRGTPEHLIEQEIRDRIFFSRGTGHFEKGMYGFLRNVKEMNLVYQAREEEREIRGYGYE